MHFWSFSSKRSRIGKITHIPRHSRLAGSSRLLALSPELITTPHMEDSGRIMRGRFVEGLGGAQFAERLTIDRLRDLATQATQTRHYTPVALSANDPANVWGNLLPWPAHPATLVPTRRAGALVVVSGGKLLLYLAQGGKKMLVWQEKEELLAPEVFHALTTALRREPRLRFTLTEVNDLPVRQTPMFTLLREAGFSSSPQGLDWG